MSLKSATINLLPDATVIGSITLAYFFDRYFSIVELIPYPINLIGWIVIAMGVIVALHTISIIRSNNRTSNVTDVPPSLITNGLYGISRNPFYLSYVAITVGAALVFGSLTAFVAPLICISILQFIIIPIEENKLEKVLNEEYERYKHTTRRWI